MRPSAVSLQLLDRIHPLLQHHFLLVERFHLQLDLLQVRLLRLQLLDALVLIIQLRLPGMIEVEEKESAEQHARSDEYQRQGCPGVHRPPRRFRPRLSK